VTLSLTQAIKDQAQQLGFALAGITSPESPPHWSIFQDWLTEGRHGSMSYLADERSRRCRANPRELLPECHSILVLGKHYPNPKSAEVDAEPPPHGRVAAYAWGEDYHNVLPERMKALVDFIEEQVGHPVSNRWYTDTGPILERDLAMRAGLGWIGRNTCLINPSKGSYFLVSEILLGIELEPDLPFNTDHCGTCTRCIEACPTQCILTDRTMDARRCISYMTIELKDDIPTEFRSQLGDWVFGCDVCQMVCPWNRFATRNGDPVFTPRDGLTRPQLIQELALTPDEFKRKFKNSPIKRAKRRGYLRNVTVALGNSKDPQAIPSLLNILQDPEPMVREHAAWALDQLTPQDS
jgi:epoxyqueuosine reductase